MDSNDPILVSKVRDKLENEFKTHPDLYDACDLDRLRDNDWYIRRYLLATRLDVENAFVMARDAMKWRKEFGVNYRTELDFPIEFYRIGILFPYCVDREGKDVIYLRVKMYKYLPKFAEYFKQFFIYIINQIDTKSGEKGMYLFLIVIKVGDPIYTR